MFNPLNAPGHLECILHESILLFRSSIDASEQNGSGLVIVNEEHERMIAVKLRRFQRSGRSETEQYCGRCCC